MKKSIILVIPLLMISIICNAVQDETPESMVETFFQTLTKGKISEAYDQLFKGSNIPTAKPQAVEMVKMQTASGLPLYGNIIGFEKIRDEKIGTSIVRLVYVLKSENAPTVWEFYFYKPKSDWFLANVIFNDQFQLLDAKE